MFNKKTFLLNLYIASFGVMLCVDGFAQIYDAQTSLPNACTIDFLAIDENNTANNIRAKWQLNTYHITYNLDGGINNPNNPNVFTIESDTIVLHKPTKTGYLFEGWYDANGERYSEILYGSHGDLELFAHWTELCADGKWLHVDNEKLCLSAKKHTTPSLAVRIDGNVYYANMTPNVQKVISTGTTEKLKIRLNGVVYSVHDISVE